MLIYGLGLLEKGLIPYATAIAFGGSLILTIVLLMSFYDWIEQSVWLLLIPLLFLGMGIAGLHRIFPVLKEFTKSEVDAIIVVAGMEGALASVVSSSVNVPVVGVPTSVGYGYGEKGVAALASMLQSCSLGLTVVNIDNGIGAGAAAAKIVNQISR